MSISRDYPEQLGEQERDLRDDPVYVGWSAHLEGETDAANGIAYRDGAQKLRERGADITELKAYYTGWAIERILRDSGIKRS